MTAQEIPSTRPYLIRAMYEWCIDNGFTPYVAVRVDDSVQVPREYVKDGEIVLNISHDATSALQLGNECLEFKGRFGGKPREILVPMGRVVAVYARENGQGMAFQPLPGEMSAAGPVSPAVLPGSGPILPADLPGSGPVTVALADADARAPGPAPSASRVVQLVVTEGDNDGGDAPKPPPPAAPGGARPALKRIK